ncbi:hypothetical protein AAFP94_14750 [Flavobacteriaceae bacterium MJ-SS4]|uniref:hypothetical protein n=1 Tax=Gilvirhabdus luticola TaxID=3079858 RepID=UPI0032DDBF49
MKNIAFVIIVFIPFLGFVQNDFENGVVVNENTLEIITFKDELFIEQSKSETKLRELKSINDTIKKRKVHYDVSLGIFMPTNQVKLIGVKPTFGFSFGLIHKRMIYDLTIDVRFGKTSSEYQLADGTSTDHYLGGYAGIDILRDIWSNNKNQILILGGLGLDVFEIEPGVYRDPNWWETLFFGEDRITIDQPTNIFSPNINFGLMYRFYYNKKNYFGIRYKFNLVDYNSKKIFTDITGNFHSITINFGGKI